jgi:hypothetical protein
MRLQTRGPMRAAIEMLILVNDLEVAMGAIAPVLYFG